MSQPSTSTGTSKGMQRITAIGNLLGDLRTASGTLKRQDFETASDRMVSAAKTLRGLSEHITEVGLDAAFPLTGTRDTATGTMYTGYKAMAYQLDKKALAFGEEPSDPQAIAGVLTFLDHWVNNFPELTLGNSKYWK